MNGGQITRYQPGTVESDVLADGFDRLYEPALTSRAVVALERGAGRAVEVRPASRFGRSAAWHRVKG